MNNLPSKLKNRYVVLRHGKSQANELDVIASHADRGVSQFGLTEEGKDHVRQSVSEAKKDGLLDASTYIWSSDFLRTKETASITAEVLHTPAAHISFTKNLRERYFGNFEGGPGTRYEKVWEQDRRNAHHKEEGVESVEEVLDRTTALVAEIERQYSGQTILFVSHGDTLQILQTAFDEIRPGAHRSLPSLKTAEIRPLH